MQRAVTAEVEARVQAALDAGDLRRAAHEGILGYGPELLGYLVAVLRHEEDARDVFSRTAELIWRDLAGYRREASFRTWAYRVTWCAAVKFRTRAQRQRAVPLDEALHDVVDTVRSATPPYLRTSIKDRFAELRARLTDEERALLVLRIDRRLPWRDVALALSEDGDVDEAALRKRFERLKTKIRKLAAEGP